MKKAIKSLFVVGLFLAIPLFSMTAPPPPNNGLGAPGSGNDPVGGGAPIGSGIAILLGLAAAYGGKKLYDGRKESLAE